MVRRFCFIIMMVVLAVGALSCRPQGQPSKVWLHRANDIAKAQYFQDKYAGLEVDVHFVDTLGSFVVQHDFGANSKLRLEEWFASLDNRSKLGFWIDFKNLNVDNMEASAKEMARLRETYDLKGMIIVESSNARCLKAFDDLNFHTSYYIPFFYPEEESQEKIQEITAKIRDNIETYGLKTISGYFFQYQYMKDSFPDVWKLIWYEHYDERERDKYIRLADEDDKTDVILVAVKKAFLDPMTNFGCADTVVLDMDLENVVNQGIVIPSARQCDEGSFVFSFEGEEGLFYKIFYQNESYKFPNDNELSYENFYGSWEDVNVGFKKIQKSGKVCDSIRIVGNPRDEKRFYGKDFTENPYNPKRIESIIAAMRNQPEWYESIEKKAADNKVSVERQLYLDAVWMIKHGINEGDFNNRWKRNPRVGCYSFMLVVCDAKALDLIPEYVKNIGKTDENGKFVNPYTFFEKNKIDGVEVIYGKRILKTRAVLTPSFGLYIKGSPNQNSEKLYSEALFEQFFGDVSRQYCLRNIPVIQDVVSDENPYTRAQYEANKTCFDSTQLLYDYPVVSDKPGTTVMIDDSDNSIVLVNPGNDDINNLRKESTGIRTRLGFTYGKFCGKIKFPVMLNDEHIWNGLTNAFWLIHQDEHQWNNRRTSKTGYVHKSTSGEFDDPERLSDYCYSEIDIEIAKASRFWPVLYYSKWSRKRHVEDASLNNDVVVGCTNWDMACRDPKKYKSRVFKMPYKDREFEAMRWTKNMQAMTIRTPINADIFKEEYYYYEIDWEPKSITWRLGPSPDKMQVVGYMCDEYSSIPDNQMLCVVTQEYHYSEWWAPVVFWQGLIPYNKSDIKGKVFEIVIE